MWTSTEFAEFEVQPTIFAYNELKVATKDFHPDTKLGEGAYGVVYKVLTFIIPYFAYYHASHDITKIISTKNLIHNTLKLYVDFIILHEHIWVFNFRFNDQLILRIWNFEFM